MLWYAAAPITVSIVDGRTYSRDEDATLAHPFTVGRKLYRIDIHQGQNHTDLVIRIAAAALSQTASFRKDEARDHSYQPSTGPIR
jgi:hypothetical protein